MYYLDEIMDRTVDGWSTMLGATEYSFWASSEIEMKPTLAATETPDTSDTPETETATSSPAETPAWEPADTNTEARYVADNWNESTEEACESNPISETLQNIAGTARQVIEEINPFTAADSEDD